MKLVKTLIAVSIIIITFIRCTPSIIVISNADFESINLKLDIESTVDPAVSETLNMEFQHFIEDYNSKKKPFYLTNYEIQTERTISLHVINNKLVNKDQQVAGAIVTALGLTVVPLVMASGGAPIVIGFYYIPHDKSVVNLYVSDDINGLETPYLTTNFSNSGFLRSYNKQIEKHGKKFDEYLSLLIKGLEKEYIKKNKEKKIAKNSFQ